MNVLHYYYQHGDVDGFAAAALIQYLLPQAQVQVRGVLGVAGLMRSLRRYPADGCEVIMSGVDLKETEFFTLSETRARQITWITNSVTNATAGLRPGSDVPFGAAKSWYCGVNVRHNPEVSLTRQILQEVSDRYDIPAGTADDSFIRILDLWTQQRFLDAPNSHATVSAGVAALSSYPLSVTAWAHLFDPATALDAIRSMVESGSEIERAVSQIATSESICATPSSAYFGGFRIIKGRSANTSYSMLQVVASEIYHPHQDERAICEYGMAFYLAEKTVHCVIYTNFDAVKDLVMAYVAGARQRGNYLEFSLPLSEFFTKWY